jgi:hypothetical protein
VTAGLQIPPCLGGEISVSGRKELRDNSEVPRSCRSVQQVLRAVQPEQCRIFLSIFFTSKLKFLPLKKGTSSKEINNKIKFFNVRENLFETEAAIRPVTDAELA